MTWCFLCPIILFCLNKLFTFLGVVAELIIMLFLKTFLVYFRMPLFGSSKKTPGEVSKTLTDSFNILKTADPKGKKAEKVEFT